MTWSSLSNIVRKLQGFEGLVPPDPPFRERAAALAVAAYGLPTVTDLPALVNCAGLALSMPRLTVHRVSSGVSRTVAETDLHSLPGEPPRLLRGSWLLESRRPEEPLFGDTACLGGYELEGSVYLVGLGYPDGARVARWTPRWRDEDLDAGVVRDESPLIDDVDAHREWAREAARYAVVLGLLLEAEGSPVAMDDELEGRGARRLRPAGTGRGEWVIRRVYLGRLTPSGRRAPDTPGEASDLSGRLAAQVPVRGHVKRQRHGPGGADRKWIYVEGYEARRWVSPRPLRVEVKE